MGKVNLQCEKEDAREWKTELLSSTLQDYRAEKAEGTKNSLDFKRVGDFKEISLNIYYMPNVWHTLVYSIFTTILVGRYY